MIFQKIILHYFSALAQYLPEVVEENIENTLSTGLCNRFATLRRTDLNLETLHSAKWFQNWDALGYFT
jgi:hypothetical protein